MTVVFMRNPWNYFDLLSSIGHRYFAWDYGSAMRQRANPLTLMKARLGADYKFEALSLAVEGAAYFDNTCTSIDAPLEVYPSWDWEEGFDQLIEYCKKPVGNDPGYYDNEKIPRRFRPVMGQRHRIVVWDPPSYSGAALSNWFGQLLKIAENYPEVQFIMFGTKSFRLMFLGEFYGAVFNPEFEALRNSVILPTGFSVIRVSDIGLAAKRWIRSLGHDPEKVRKDVAARTAFQIDSVNYAGNFFATMQKTNMAFAINATDKFGDTVPDDNELLRMAQANMSMTRLGGAIPINSKLLPGDGIVCNDCSFAEKCRFFREGAVCGMPGSESAKLAKMLGSRDADRVIEGLSKIAEFQAERVHKDLEQEEIDGKRYPDTDRRLKDLFDSGQKIARLIKPELNGKGVQVNVGVLGAASISQNTTPQELISHAVAALEGRGVAREDVTPEAILGVLEGVGSRSAGDLIEDVIDAEVME